MCQSGPITVKKMGIARTAELRIQWAAAPAAGLRGCSVSGSEGRVLKRRCLLYVEWCFLVTLAAVLIAISI